MKKKSILFASLLCVFNLFAQNTEHSNQTIKQLNFGLIGASYEFPVHKDISVAPYAGTGFELNWLSLGVKGNYYFDSLLNLSSEWDVYGGVNSGYAIGLNNKDESDSFNMGLHVGGRWFWNDKWGLYLEFGSGNTTKGIGSIGVTMKL